MKKKKIYFILPGLTFGGAERVISILANELDSEKFQTTIVLFSKKGFHLDELKSRVQIIDFNIERIRSAIFPLLKLIYKDKPDFVMGGWGEVSALLAPFISFFSKTKFVARETNVVSEHVKRKEILFLYKFYNRFHKIIAQSNDMQRDLIKNFNISPQKLVKINNPVNFDLLDQKLTEKVKLPFDPKFKNVVAIGNLSHRKGFDMLLKVFSHLKNEHIKLYILGDGDEREELFKLKEDLELNNVEFLGIQTNPYPFLAKADLFVLSSRYEGFPNVLLEAGACGTYALANNCPGGIDEIIQPNINGEISSIENAEEFASKIKVLVSQDYDSELIRDSIRSRFAKEIIVEQYNQVFDSL